MNNAPSKSMIRRCVFIMVAFIVVGFGVLVGFGVAVGSGVGVFVGAGVEVAVGAWVGTGVVSDFCPQAARRSADAVNSNKAFFFIVIPLVHSE